MSRIQRVRGFILILISFFAILLARQEHQILSPHPMLEEFAASRLESRGEYRRGEDIEDGYGARGIR
jgi:hypothetical protein